MAANATVRVTEETRASLRRLAAARGLTVPAALEEMAAKAEDEAFLDQVTTDFARLAADPEAHADYEAESSTWEATVADGLESLEP